VVGCWHRAEVQWDAGTGLRRTINLRCPCSAAGVLSPSSSPAPLSLLLGGTGKAGWGAQGTHMGQ